MKNKNTIKIVIGVALVIVASLVVFLILKIKKPEEIKIGVTKEEVISIFDKNKYQYTINTISDEYIEVSTKNEKISIKNIKGTLIVGIENEKVTIVYFSPNIDEKKKSQQIERLTKYLINLYGDPYEEERQGGIYKHWFKGDIRISFGYSLDENSEIQTRIAWILQNMSKE